MILAYSTREKEYKKFVDYSKTLPQIQDIYSKAKDEESRLLVSNLVKTGLESRV